MATRTPQPDPAEEFLRLACLTYAGDDLALQERAAEMLRRDPSLASRSIYTAAAAGDAATAARLLGADPSLATTAGGPNAWDPLLYLAYSRVTINDPDPDPDPTPHVTVARLLLDHGADPNTGVWIGENLFTALTGAFGYGEDAPNQPPHPESIPLARLLLEAGADPNDEQTIYNRHFRTDNSYLELLLAYGLGKPRRGPWRERLGKDATSPQLLLEDALVFVANDDAHAGRVALLVDSGVDPDGRGTQHPALHGRRPVELAFLAGARQNTERLLKAGARPLDPDPVDALLAAATRGEREAVERRLASDPALAAALRERHPEALAEAAERGQLTAVELLGQIGYDPNSRSIGRPAIHLAAYAGDQAMCELLIRLGAEPAPGDRHFNAPASGWARHAHHQNLAQWLREREVM